MSDSSNKRKLPGGGALVVSKRAKTDDSSANALVERKAGQLILPSGPKRTSALLAPTMKLEGHQGAVLCCKFNQTGTNFATAGQDKQILLWETYGECKNFATLKGHDGVVLDLVWGRDGDKVYSAGADKIGAIWDVNTETRIKKLRANKKFVNTIDKARRGDPMVVTGGDDCQVFVYDERARAPVAQLNNEYQILSCCFSDDSSQVFAAGIDAKIHCWDIRKQAIVYSLEGHNDTITGIKLSADGSFILSNSRDNTLRSWDIRPFVSSDSKTGRGVSVFTGHQHDFQENMLRCAWSGDGTQVTCGSADKFVYVWDVHTQKVLYKLPGHKGCVNEVDFHPEEPVILSASSDKTLYLGEIVATV